MSEESTSKEAYYAAKFGATRLPAIQERLSSAAQKVGIDIILKGKIGAHMMGCIYGAHFFYCVCFSFEDLDVFSTTPRESNVIRNVNSKLIVRPTFELMDR